MENEGLSSSRSAPDGDSALLTRQSSQMMRRTRTTDGSLDAPRGNHLRPDDDRAAMLCPTTSNVQRSELSPSIPFGAVVHFTNHSLAPSQLHPWKAGTAKTFRGTGFYIGEQRIITNSHVIHNQTSLRLKRHGQPGDFAGRLLCESKLCDLALVTVDDESFWSSLPSVELQESTPELDETVLVVGYPASSGAGAKSVTVTRGVVSNVQMLDLTLEPKGRNPRQLTVQIDAAINSGNSGGPVFNVDTCAVVGVAFAAGRAQGHGLIIPVAVLKNFLRQYERTQAPNFGLLPEVGFGFDKLVNPAFRKSCFGGILPSHRDGVIVTSVSKYGCATEKVQVGDVVMAIDGVPVTEDGDVLFRGQEYLGLE